MQLLKDYIFGSIAQLPVKFF